MNSRYRYRQIFNSAIRLIEIEPRKLGLPVSCKIYDASRDHEYLALSYVCGDQSKRVPILLIGLDFDVGQNLHDFLQLASEDYADMPMWIDELCIHQSDPDERSSQVQQIGETYQNAQRVIAWLGPAGYPASVVFAQPSAMQPPFKAIKHFFDLNYFTRLWTYQEFLLAKNLVLLRGKHQIHARTLIDYLGNFMSFNIDSQNNDPFLFDLDDEIYDVRLSRGFHLLQRCNYGSPKLNLHELLGIEFDGECSEWRDRVFGILSLCSQKQYIPVDYRISPEDMVISLLIACDQSKQQNAMEVLSHLCRIYQIHQLNCRFNTSCLGQTLNDRYELMKSYSSSFFLESPRSRRRFRVESALGSPTTIVCGYCLKTLKGTFGRPICLICAKESKIHAVFWDMGGSGLQSIVHVVRNVEPQMSILGVKYSQSSTVLVNTINIRVRRKIKSAFYFLKDIMTRSSFEW